MSNSFREKVRDAFGPPFEERGFKTKKYKFGRKNKDFLFCIGFQAKSDRNSYCVELGVQPLFLPTDFNNLSDQFNPIDCEFRERLSAEGMVDQWFTMKSLIKGETLDVMELFDSEGAKFFSYFQSLEGAFGNVTLASIEEKQFDARLYSTTVKRLILVAAKAQEQLGNYDEARNLAQYGLENVGLAVGLKSKFRPLLHRLKDNLSF